jgi:large subunit ribosomal protein L1
MSKDNLDALLEEAEEKLEKGEALDEVETEHHGKIKEVSKKESVEDKIKHAKMEKAEEQEETEAETKENSDELIEEKKVKTKKTKKGKAKVRSKKYQELKTLIDAKKRYGINDAVELAQKTSMTKFAGNLEVHIRILGKSGKPEQLRGMVQYPYATGKSISVVILDEKTIEEIAKTQKAEANIYLTSPTDMPKVAKLAKILGPKGKMPNPKSGTITENPEKTKKELESGSTEYRSDAQGNVHQVLGKLTDKAENLIENYKALIALLPVEKIVSISVCATMGPGIKVQK